MSFWVSKKDRVSDGKIQGYVIWSLAGIYLLLLFCFFDRIQLAIAVNKVAATFVSLEIENSGLTKVGVAHVQVIAFLMNSGHIPCELLECPSYNLVSASSGVSCGEFL